MSTPNAPQPYDDPELNEEEKVALDEGHDADLPTASNGKHTTNTYTSTFDPEKHGSGGHDSTSPSTTDENEDTTSKEHDTTANDPNAIDWDSLTDPQNPQNYPTGKKWRIIALISALTFATPLGSTIFAPGVPQVMRDFHSSNTELASFMVSVYILGFAFGPIIVAPMSEAYGRVPVTHISTVGFLVFTIACAVSTNMSMFVTFRFFMGAFGATPLTVGSGIIADMMPPEKRGGALSIWALGPMMGPIIGPIAGGYIVEGPGWRWVFWVEAIIIVVLMVLSFVFLRETYAVTLLGRKAARLRKETGNQELYSKLDLRLSTRELFVRSIVRPVKMLCLQPIVTLMAVDMAIVYGYLYLLFTTFTYVFERQYGFTSGQAGLVYLGLGIGSLIGLVVFGGGSDWLMKHKAKKNNGVFKPEFRLPPLIPGAFLVPVGLFWYGWSAQANTHYIVPILGSGVVGTGMLATFMGTQTYVVDAFPRYAASATAAMTILRSLLGAILPLAGQSMYGALGLGWGNSLLGKSQ